MVWVVACEAPASLLWREQAAGKSATSVSRTMVFTLRYLNAEAMQFP